MFTGQVDYSATTQRAQAAFAHLDHVRAVRNEPTYVAAKAKGLRLPSTTPVAPERSAPVEQLPQPEPDRTVQPRLRARICCGLQRRIGAGDYSHLGVVLALFFWNKTDDLRSPRRIRLADSLI